MIRNGLALAVMAAGFLPGAADAFEMWMRRANATSTIVMSGKIEAGDADRFKAFWGENAYDSFNFIIATDSLGGSLRDGIEIGRFIRSVGAKTEVARYEAPAPGQSEFDYGPELAGGGCYSACALAFMGGMEREVSGQAELGFHQFSGGPDEDASSARVSAQGIAAMLSGYLREMGAAPELFERMSMTHPNDMYVPDRSEFETLGIVPAMSFRDFRLLPRDGIIVAQARNLHKVSSLERAIEVETMCWKGVPIINFYAETAEDGLRTDQASEPVFARGFSVETDTGSWEFDRDRMRLYAHSRILATLQLDPQIARAVGTSSQAFVSVSSGTASGFFVSGRMTAGPGGDPAIMASFKDCL